MSTFFLHCVSSCCTELKTSSLSGGRRNLSRTSLIGLVEIFRTKPFCKNSQITLVSRKEFLMSAVEKNTLPPQQIAALL